MNKTRIAIYIGQVVIVTVLQANVRISAPTKLHEVLTEDLSLTGYGAMLSGKQLWMFCIPECLNLNQHQYENLKSHKFILP